MDGSNNRAPASCFNTGTNIQRGQALSVQCEWPILGIFVLNTEINGKKKIFLLDSFYDFVEYGTKNMTTGKRHMCAATNAIIAIANHQKRKILTLLKHQKRKEYRPTSRPL